MITLLHSESPHCSLNPLDRALTLVEPDPQMDTQQLQIAAQNATSSGKHSLIPSSDLFSTSLGFLGRPPTRILACHLSPPTQTQACKEKSACSHSVLIPDLVHSRTLTNICGMNICPTLSVMGGHFHSTFLCTFLWQWLLEGSVWMTSLEPFSGWDAWSHSIAPHTVQAF